MKKIQSTTRGRTGATQTQSGPVTSFDAPPRIPITTGVGAVSATSAVGYLADNWSGFNRDTPALIVNPQASPRDLLAWCWGEVRSLQSSAQALGTAGELIEPADFAAMFQHRLDPLAEVMSLAMGALHAAQCASADGG